MILKDNSILKFLPIGLEKRQLLILDSLRFTIEIIDFSFENLTKLLLETSLAEKRTCKLSEIFIQALNLVDYAKRFYSLYQKMPSNNNHANVQKLDFLRDFRNTYQHIDERIDESIMNNEKPIYGALKWEYKDLKNNKVMSCLAISGINMGTKDHPYYFNELTKSQKEINNIILETVNRKKMQEINLSDLIDMIQDITQKLEMQLEEQFNKNGLPQCDWIKRKDVILFFKNQ